LLYPPDEPNHDSNVERPEKHHKVGKERGREREREREREKKERQERENRVQRKRVGNVKREKIIKPHSKEEIHHSSTPEEFKRKGER